MRLYELQFELYQLARKELRPGNSLDEINTKLKDFATKKGEFISVWP